MNQKFQRHNFKNFRYHNKEGIHCRLTIILLVVLLSPISIFATSPDITSMTDVEEVTIVNEAMASSANPQTAEPESIFPQSSRPLWQSHFTWGVDVGTSIDLRGNDLSTIDADVMIGYKSNFIRTLGLGAGVHRAVSQKNTFYPLYLVFRSSFRNKPSLFFFNLRAGYAFSNLGTGVSRGGPSAAIGVGINLAMSKKFQSHILLSYCYYHINRKNRVESGLTVKYVDLARISFGVNF